MKAHSEIGLLKEYRKLQTISAQSYVITSSSHLQTGKIALYSLI